MSLCMIKHNVIKIYEVAAQLHYPHRAIQDIFNDTHKLPLSRYHPHHHHNLHQNVTGNHSSG